MLKVFHRLKQWVKSLRWERALKVLPAKLKHSSSVTVNIVIDLVMSLYHWETASPNFWCIDLFYSLTAQQKAAFCLEKPYGCCRRSILHVQVEIKSSVNAFTLYKTTYNKCEFNLSSNTGVELNLIQQLSKKQMQWETWGSDLNNQHFIACLECSRQSSPLTTTEWSASRQTRNDEEVTDWWKWWAIIFLY